MHIPNFNEKKTLRIEPRSPICSTLEQHNLFFLSIKIYEDWTYTLRRLMSQDYFFQQKFRFSLIPTDLFP